MALMCVEGTRSKGHRGGAFRLELEGMSVSQARGGGQESQQYEQSLFIWGPEMTWQRGAVVLSADPAGDEQGLIYFLMWNRGRVVLFAEGCDNVTVRTRAQSHAWWADSTPFTGLSRASLCGGRGSDFGAGGQTPGLTHAEQVHPSPAPVLSEASPPPHLEACWSCKGSTTELPSSPQAGFQSLTLFSTSDIGTLQMPYLGVGENQDGTFWIILLLLDRKEAASAARDILKAPKG